jgi:hypothetical protein
MFDSLKEVLDKVSGPADLAVVLIAGSGGFVVDALLIAHGVLSPGQVGASSAAGALGLKKAIEASLVQRKVNRNRCP